MELWSFTGIELGSPVQWGDYGFLNYHTIFIPEYQMVLKSIFEVETVTHATM